MTPTVPHGMLPVSGAAPAQTDGRQHDDADDEVLHPGPLEPLRRRRHKTHPWLLTGRGGRCLAGFNHKKRPRRGPRPSRGKKKYSIATIAHDRVIRRQFLVIGQWPWRLRSSSTRWTSTVRLKNASEPVVLKLWARRHALGAFRPGQTAAATFAVLCAKFLLIHEKRTKARQPGRFVALATQAKG